MFCYNLHCISTMYWILIIISRCLDSLDSIHMHEYYRIFLKFVSALMFSELPFKIKLCLIFRVCPCLLLEDLVSPLKSCIYRRNLFDGYNNNECQLKWCHHIYWPTLLHLNNWDSFRSHNGWWMTLTPPIQSFPLCKFGVCLSPLTFQFARNVVRVTKGVSLVF